MTDYVIVGGGSAGCVLAARLSEDPQTHVTLLEAGPPDDSVLIHCPGGLAAMAKTGAHGWGFHTEPQPGLNGRRGFQPRGRVLGGSSSINAMVYARGHPSDYDTWHAMGNPGWSWADVRPYFLKAEHNERGANEHHATGGPLNVADLRSPNPFARDFVQAGVQAGHPHNADFNGAANVTVETADAFQRIDSLSASAEKFGMVILDPPKFARSRAAIDDAVRAYHRINRLAVDLLESLFGKSTLMRR